MSSAAANWSDVPGDLWVSIGLRLDTASDRIRFRAVSKTLRSNLPYKQPPWLMLSEYHDSDSEEVDEEGEQEPVPPRRRFVLLGEQNYYKFDLPQAHLARCVGSTNNWVITVKTDTIIRLLNPFSKVEIDLPSQLTFEDRLPPGNEELERDNFLRKAIIYSPSGGGGRHNDFLVIAIQCRYGKLAIAKPGDSFWTNFKVEIKEHNSIRDIVVFKGRLYAINIHGLLLSSDLSNYPNPPQLSVVAKKWEIFKITHHRQVLYLVEWSGHLLLVSKYIDTFGKDELGEVTDLPFYKTDRFQIYKFDFTTRNWIEIKSLGEYSLFLGFNTSVSVLASDYFGLVKKNCIYFTDDYATGFRGTQTPGGYDMGVFDLDDNSITPHYKGTSVCLYSPPIWIVPPQ